MNTAIITKGQSDAAQYVNSTHQLIGQHFNQSAKFSRQPAYNELFQVWNECKTPNWDGNGAYPVLEETFNNAYLLIQALPIECALPSIGVEPDGDLTMEWYRNSKWVLSVSISPTGILHYAALFGSSNSRGSEVFLNQIPDILMALIKKVMLHA